MELSKMSKNELLTKCNELGFTNCKSKKKDELIGLINSKIDTKEENLENKYKSNSFENINSKIIIQINQLFHNKGIKQEDRFELLLNILDGNKDTKYFDIKNLIDNLDYNNTELIQEIFMKIGSKYTKFNLDQFYTPLTISQFINKLMIVDENNNAIDPAGGTGDLLLYYKGNKTIWDIDENALKLCKFNYTLHKQINYILDCKNSLNDFEDYMNKYTYCVMNPPFGSNTIITDKQILNKYELGKGKSKQEIGILFLELGLKLLKENGILLIIVPAGYVGNLNKNCSDMRDLILKNRLIASISLPENTFKRSGTGVNTYLLIIQKINIENNNIFINRVENIGYNLTKKDTPLKYKIVKETGELIIDKNFKPILDNDLIDVYYSLSNFINDNYIINLNFEINIYNEYEYINKNQLSYNILDVKRYLKNYLDIITYLKSIQFVKLNLLCNIITSTTKIDNKKLYKYIDISEINSPLYGHKILYGWELPSRAKYSLKKYDILISKLEGTMSYCVILDDSNNYISTNGVCVLRPNNLDNLYILFSNIMNKHFKIQHNAFLTGSIMASLSDEDIKNFLIDVKTIDIELSKKILDTLENLQKLKSN